MSQKSRLRVLIVDDDRVVADTLAVALRQHGYDAFAVYRGDDAMESAQSIRPDLIVCDVMMPGKNGIALAVQVSEFLPACRIFLFSGQDGTADLLPGVAVKGHRFEILEKPVYPLDLLAKLQQTLPGSDVA